MGPKVVGPCITSLERTDPVAAGQFISNRARVSAVLTASSDFETLSGVVLQPATNATAAIGKILSNCVFMVCTATGCPVVYRVTAEFSEDPPKPSIRPKSSCDRLRHFTYGTDAMVPTLRYGISAGLRNK